MPRFSKKIFIFLRKPLAVRLWPFVFLSLIFTEQGFSQEISFQAEVNTNTVSLGSVLQLNLQVEGAQNVSAIDLPEIEGFDVRYLGPSTQVSIINGQYTSSKTFTYSLLPLREGQFHIPSFGITIDGQTYRTQPIDVEVVGSSGSSIAPSNQNQSKFLKDKIFLVLKTAKQDVYLNERLPVKILLFISDLAVEDVHYPQMEQVGFSLGDYEKPRQYQQLIGGIRYAIIEFDTVIYPTRTGQLSLGPAKIECNLLVKGTSRQRSIFDDDFFDAFFNRYEKRPMEVVAQEIQLNVWPLPQEGQPKDFSGAVGEFDFEASVSPTQVQEGDPITLKLKVSGNGNLKAVNLSTIKESEYFKLYDPQVQDDGRTKTLEQVVIPKSTEIKEIPAVEFSYFDTQLKKYRTLRKGPFPMEVTKPDQKEPFKIVGLQQGIKEVEPEALGRDIVFIKEEPGRFRPLGEHFYQRFLFYMILGMAALLWLGAYVLYQRTHKIATDIVYARRLLAPKQAKLGLKQAKRFFDANQKGEFYDTMFKTLQQYLGNKLHLPSGAVTFDMVQSHLDSDKIDQEVFNEIKAFFEQCDTVRYASAHIDKNDMQQSYARIQRIIDYLERHWK